MLNWLIFLFTTFLIGILLICYFFLNAEDDEKESVQKEKPKTVVTGPKVKTKLDVVDPNVKSLKEELGSDVSGTKEMCQIGVVPKVGDSEEKCNVMPENVKNILEENLQLQNDLEEKDKKIIGLQSELESERSKSQEWIKKHLEEVIGNFASEIKEFIAKPAEKDKTPVKKRSSARFISECNLISEETSAWPCSNHEFCAISESHLQFVADRIGTDWRRILRYIDINEYVIENIEEDQKYESVSEKAYQGFSTWLCKSPQEATVCLLIELLEYIERNDIIRALKEQFPRLQEESNVSPAPTKIHLASYHACGREEEIEMIKDFCNIEQTSKRLLSIAGMPGLGKSELIMEALSHVDRNKIVQPNYYIRGGSVSWAFEEVLESILHCWKININKDLKGEVDISHLLQTVDEPIILILDIAPLKGTAQIKFAIWNFLHNLLRNNQSRLKIIVATCQPPQQIALCNIPAETHLIPNLSETDSITLLQLINPVLSAQQCKEIYKHCGGHPLLLRKLSCKTKKFHNFNEDMGDLMRIISDLSLKFDYLNRLLRHTEWPIDMKYLLDLLEDNAKVVLAKLCVFVSFIPMISLSFIYSAMTKAEVQILFHDHCLIQIAPDMSAYEILPVNIGFIREYISQDEDMYFCEDNKNDLSLSEIRCDSFSRVTTFFIKLLVNLSMMYFSVSVCECDNATSNLISEFKKRCIICMGKDECKCSDHRISKAIFFEQRSSIMHFFKQVLSNSFVSSLIIKSPCEVIEFLVTVMINEESGEIHDTQVSQSCTGDKINHVVASAIQLLLNITTRKHEEAKSLKTLNSCINALQKQRDIIPGYQEVLLLCILRRARIHGIIINNQQEANKDLEISKRICAQNVSNIGRIKYHETMADVAFHFKRFKIAKENRSIQLKLTNQQLGEHPITAKAYFLLGKSLEIFEEDISEAIANYRKAREIFTILQDTTMQLEVSSVLSRLIEGDELLI